jgi:hypothetical protein
MERAVTSTFCRSQSSEPRGMHHLNLLAKRHVGIHVCMQHALLPHRCVPMMRYAAQKHTAP